MMIVNSVDY